MQYYVCESVVTATAVTAAVVVAVSEYHCRRLLWVRFVADVDVQMRKGNSLFRCSLLLGLNGTTAPMTAATNRAPISILILFCFPLHSFNNEAI